LTFDTNEEWEILISIPLRGSKEPAYNTKNAVRLQIRPDPDWQWELRARVSDRGEYSQSEKKTYRNDLDLPVLGSGNLHTFPTWLKQVRDKSGLDFDIEAADIRVGRKRAAIKLISRWLANQ